MTFNDWDAFPKVLMPKPKNTKVEQVELLNKLRKNIDDLRPPFRHTQESSYDAGQSNGITKAILEIDKMILTIQAGT